MEFRSPLSKAFCETSRCLGHQKDQGRFRPRAAKVMPCSPLPCTQQYCSARHLGRDVIAFIAETCVTSIGLVYRSTDYDESRHKALSNQPLDHFSNIVPNTIAELRGQGSGVG